MHIVLSKCHHRHTNLTEHLALETIRELNMLLKTNFKGRLYNLDAVLVHLRKHSNNWIEILTRTKSVDFITGIFASMLLSFLGKCLVNTELNLVKMYFQSI